MGILTLLAPFVFGFAAGTILVESLENFLEGNTFLGVLYLAVGLLAIAIAFTHEFVPYNFAV